MTTNTADHRCRACGASISEVSGLCVSCEPALPMVGEGSACAESPECGYLAECPDCDRCDDCCICGTALDDDPADYADDLDDEEDEQ